MADLELVAPSILQNPIYLTLTLEWLPPPDLLNCAIVCKHWSTSVSQTWKSCLQRISPALHDVTVHAVKKKKAQVSPETIFRNFALNEFKSLQEIYNLPIDTAGNYRKYVDIQELKYQKKDKKVLAERRSQEFSNPPTKKRRAVTGNETKKSMSPKLELEDLLLVVHLCHLPTRTPMCSVVWNMNDVLEEGFIYCKGDPILTKEVEFRIPIGSVAGKNGAVSFAKPFDAIMAAPRSAGWSGHIATAVSVQLYRCDIGQAIDFERAQIMQAESWESLRAAVSTKYRRSLAEPNPASMPLPREDLQYLYFDPENFARMAGSKGYPAIGFKVGVGNAELDVSQMTRTHKTGRMTIEVHKLIAELFPAEHRTTIRWKEDLRKHLQYMDWE